MEALDTRAALLKAAEELFASRGFEGTSVKDICEKAGVNVSLISYHFEGKEGLYRAVLEQFGTKGLELAERVLTTPKSKEEFLVRLKMFAEEIITTHARSPNCTRIIHRECSMENLVARDVFQKTFASVFKRFLGYITEARDRGFLRKDLDPLIAASAFFGSVTHFCNTDTMRKEFFGFSIQDEKFRAKSIEHLTDIFVRGVVA
jgi:TetR/AcrR family transcriptional regulator